MTGFLTTIIVIVVIIAKMFFIAGSLQQLPKSLLQLSIKSVFILFTYNKYNIKIFLFIPLNNILIVI